MLLTLFQMTLVPPRTITIEDILSVLLVLYDIELNPACTASADFSIMNCYLILLSESIHLEGIASFLGNPQKVENKIFVARQYFIPRGLNDIYLLQGLLITSRPLP